MNAYERMDRRLRRGLLMLGVAALCASLPAMARHHAHARAAAAPGEFDYYLLSLSWSPAYCLGAPSSEECSGSRRFGFIVHGLWPQNERGWPEHCGAQAEVPEAVVDSVADLMPARKLVYHEWSAHGTCSGLGPADFFALVRRARGAVTIPAAFSDPGAAVEESPAAIVEAFARANPRLPAQSVVATCSRQGAPRLQEVHVCLNRDLSARACSAAVLNAGCRAASVIVPPVR